MINRTKIGKQIKRARGGSFPDVTGDGKVTKKDILAMLNWGVRISFSGYRNRLRNEPTIRFTKNRYEVI